MASPIVVCCRRSDRCIVQQLLDGGEIEGERRLQIGVSAEQNQSDGVAARRAMKSVTTLFTALRRFVTRPLTSMSSVFMLPEMSMASTRSRPLLGKLTGSPELDAQQRRAGRSKRATRATTRGAAASRATAPADRRSETADIRHAQRASCR